MNTFSDIFKNSFLEGFSGSNISTGQILVTLLVACVLAVYIFGVYYLKTRSTFYSKSFNISLALIAVITAGIILAMQSNIVISLGMVGALSIVRFRTAVKDPMDLIFLFWSISIGIVCGAGMFQIAVITSVIITIGLFVLEFTPIGRAAVILIVNADTLAAVDAVKAVTAKYSRVVKVKSRNVTQNNVDVIIECKPQKDSEDTFLKEVTEVKGVYSASLMAHDGEVTL